MPTGLGAPKGARAYDGNSIKSNTPGMKMSPALGSAKPDQIGV